MKKKIAWNRIHCQRKINSVVQVTLRGNFSNITCEFYLCVCWQNISFLYIWEKKELIKL